MSFFNTREETNKEIKITLKSTSWQNYINIFFILCVIVIQIVFWQKKIIQEKVEMPFLIFGLSFILLWFIIGITINLGNRKAIKEINTAVKEGKHVTSEGSPFSIKNPRTLTIPK